MNDKDLLKVKKAQANILLKKLASGHLLTKAEMELIESVSENNAKYAKTQQELADILGIDRSNLSSLYMSLPGAPEKTKNGYNVLSCKKWIQEVKSSRVKGDGTLRDEKLKREIERLDILIQKELGDLVDRKETESALLAELHEYRKVIEDWRAHETAKHPDHSGIIDQLANTLVDKLRERCED